MKIRPFEPADVVALDLQGAQQGVLGIYEPQMSLRYGFMLRDAGPAFTAVDGRGLVRAAAGFAEVFDSRQATAWALFGEGWWGALDRKEILRALRKGMSAAPYARIEALARVAVPGECRLLAKVGFRRVCDLAQWGPNSETVTLFEKLGRAG